MRYKYTSTLLALLLTVSVFTIPGCTTVGGTGDPVVSQQTLNDAAIILRGAARGAAAIAIQEKPDTRKYVQLAVTILDQLILDEGNYTPGALVDALKPVLKEVNDVKIAIAINTVTDLYEVFYGRYIKARLKEKENAYMFIKSLRDGAASALEITTNPVR